MTRKLDPRNPSDHRRIAREAERPRTPDSWWTRPVPREEWQALAKAADARMNAVSTTQHVQRREGDR